MATGGKSHSQILWKTVCQLHRQSASNRPCKRSLSSFSSSNRPTSFGGIYLRLLRRSSKPTRWMFSLPYCQEHSGLCTIGRRGLKTDAERSFTVFPAGSNGEFNLPPDLTTVIEGGKGCKIWDTNGRTFVDFSMGWGTALVGHAREEVVKAVKQQCELGSNFAYVNDKALELAEKLVKLSPAMEQMRFCASGTEATMYCMRLARAITKKKKILKFEGAYHGGNDEGTTSLFPRHYKPYPQADPTSAGIDHVKDNVLVAPYNQLFEIQSIIKEHADDIAAVIVEPLHRCTTPLPGFLESLREMTNQHGILLIFDEVVTGFRLALGGAQEYYGVIPDLVAYGKALGGGYPIGVFGGKRKIMKIVSEDLMDHDDRYVWTASSLGGNPICCSAALAALNIYEQEGTYKQLHEIGAYLREGMNHCLETVGITGYAIGDGPLAQILHSEKMPYDYSYREQKQMENARQRRHTMIGLYRRGIFLNPMGTKFYLSLQHTKDDCDYFLKCLKETLEEFKDNTMEWRPSFKMGSRLIT